MKRDPTEDMGLDQLADELDEYAYAYMEEHGTPPPLEPMMMLPSIPSDIEEFKKDPLGWGRL